jgi:hypothetical protein
MKKQKQKIHGSFSKLNFILIQKSHPERSPIMCYAEREDVMKTWISALKQVKTRLSTLDDSDVEIFSSSDEDEETNKNFCNFFSMKKLYKIFGVKKTHKYHHIVEVLLEI